MSKSNPDSVASGVRWWLAALGVVLGPLFLFVLPALLATGHYESAAAQFAAIAEQPSNLHLAGFLSQVLGAAFLVAGVLGMVRLLISRRRWVVPGHVGGGLALLGAFGIMVTVGMEIASVHFLTTGEDRQTMVGLAVDLNESTVFLSFLTAGLLGIFLGLLILIVGLWRARFIPLWTLALFAVPLAIGLAPLPGRIGEIGVLVGLLLPFVWIGWSMLREPPAGRDYAAAGGQGIRRTGSEPAVGS